MQPTVFMVCEGLRAPPRAGFHIHLLSLAQSLARHVRVRAFAWSAGSDDEGWEGWLSSLPAGPAPEQYLSSIPGGERRGSAAGRKLRYWSHVQRVVAEEARPGDVLWVRDFSTALFAWPALTRWFPGREGLIHVYDASSLMEHEVGWRGNPRIHRLQSEVEMCLRRGFDRVRTLGEGMKRELVRTGVASDRIIVAPVGASFPAQVATRSGSLRKLLYVGSTQEWQGLPILLRAMRVLEARGADLRLSVVGANPEDLRSMDAPGNVDFLGWVHRDAMPDLYAAHDLFVIPRPSIALTETVIPMKAVEALAHGIPVLASRLAALEEVYGAEGAEYCSPGSADSLAESVLRLVADPTTMRNLSAAGRERAERFRWERIVERLVEDLFPAGTD